MKHFVFILAVFAFLASSFASVAMANNCMNSSAPVNMHSEMDHSSKEPCHDIKKSDENAEKHCDGLCLCAHLSITQTSIVMNTQNLLIFAPNSEKLALNNERVLSLNRAPPLKPPIYI